MKQTSGQPAPVVGVIMGSSSDWDTMKEAAKILNDLDIPHECQVVSAHRTPDLMAEYARSASARGLRAIIAGAGGAAHLPGMVAAQTAVPVLGVPVQSKALSGMDSLLSIVQMPAGIPVATFAIGVAGARNAALFAAAMLAGEDPLVAEALETFRATQTEAARNSVLEQGTAREKTVETRCVAPPGAIHEAAELLAAGEVVALPTETVYGLGACALNAIACAKVFEAKERPLNDPLIVHLPSGDWLDRVARPSPLARTLADRFWPGPFTMVLPRCAIIPDIVTDGQETVAVRISAHPVFQEVALALDQPIAAPSANRFGRISPTEPAHVLAELGGRIPLVVDGGRCAHGLESTIVYVHEQGVEILRHGPITRELLQESVPVLSGGADAVTPGSMKSHYAPRTPLVLGLPPAEPPADLRAGLLAFSRSRPEFVAQEVLSPTGDLREAAANLYGAMRRLDDAGLEVIYAEAIPESGLGAALMERLRKAAVRD